jgi:hypothetical protein
LNAEIKIHRFVLYYFSLISLAGLFLLALLVYYSPNARIVYYPEEQLILLAFVLICLLGMVAAISPSRCSDLLDVNSNQRSFSKPTGNSRNNISVNKFEGHHPTCENFKTHTFSLMDKKLCAGCSGLFLGALIAAIGTIIYYLYGIFNGADGQVIFVIGFVTVLIYLLQDLMLNLNHSLAKFFFNMILVLGSFLLLVGIIILKSNMFIQIFFLILVCLWILARIDSSEKNHNTICKECILESACDYR